LHIHKGFLRKEAERGGKRDLKYCNRYLEDRKSRWKSVKGIDLCIFIHYPYCIIEKPPDNPKFFP
jgi:hypothetical protein